MTTWHQDKAMREGRAAPVWHDTLWTIVSDPPGKCLATSVYSSKEKAEAQLKVWLGNGLRHLYLVGPGGRNEN